MKVASFTVLMKLSPSTPESEQICGVVCVSQVAMILAKGCTIHVPSWKIMLTSDIFTRICAKCGSTHGALFNFRGTVTRAKDFEIPLKAPDSEYLHIPCSSDIHLEMMEKRNVSRD